MTWMDHFMGALMVMALLCAAGLFAVWVNFHPWKALTLATVFGVLPALYATIAKLVRR